MRAKALLASLVTGLVVLVGVRPAAQVPTSAGSERKLVLTFDGNGFANLVAQNVSVGEVFAEWARVGGTKITNAEKLPGGRISVKFDNFPEAELVKSLVRLSRAQGAGSIAVPRLVDAPPMPSRLQTISILPSSSPTNSYVTTSTPPPIYPQGTIEDNTELPPVLPPAGVGPAAQTPQPGPQQAPVNRGPGVVSVVPVGPTTPAQPPTPPPSTTGRGRGGL
jgi:hypothetical protein